jgi:hypothetical protein
LRIDGPGTEGAERFGHYCCRRISPGPRLVQLTERRPIPCEPCDSTLSAHQHT